MVNIIKYFFGNLFQLDCNKIVTIIIAIVYRNSIKNRCNEKEIYGRIAIFYVQYFY